jgi:ribosomal protein S18 acetylase RimI-like enzyme
MELIIRRTFIEEAEELLAIQKEAFSEDLKKYKDFDTSPATEPIKKLLYKINKNFHYTILMKDKIIGGAELRLDSESECYINRIFLLPEFQNKGFGTEIMKYFEREFSSVKKWTLCTPHLNFRNHRFYEKLGYKKVGEHIVMKGLNLIMYERQKVIKYERL